jgi:hypothetical protein
VPTGDWPIKMIAKTLLIKRTILEEGRYIFLLILVRLVSKYMLFFSIDIGVEGE